MLTQDQLDNFKNTLINMRKHTLDRIEGIDDGGLGKSVSESIGELSTYDNHPADVGTEDFERSKDFALRGDAMIVVGAIDSALDRMEEGKYGICEACGKEIPIERLEAVPYTTQCVDCKSRDEHLPKPHQRTAEEDVLEPPFSRTWKDNDLEYNGFDGEDSWESVAAWNEHAGESMAGSYYGDDELSDEHNIGAGEPIDEIPYFIDEEGVIYQDFKSMFES